MLSPLLFVSSLAVQSPDEALLAAAASGDVDEVNALVAAGADVNATDADGRSTLILAALRGDLPVVRALVAAGADLERRDAQGLSALTVARESKSEEMVRLLRDAGARDSTEVLLDEAIRDGDRERVTAILDRGVDVNALETSSYQTPLMTALELRELDILLTLIAAGADPTVEGTGIETSGENAITYAARQGSPWAYRRLVEAKARQTDLDRSLLVGCTSDAVLRIAVEKGARVNARNSRGMTPLMCAASEGAFESVAYLLEVGADPSLESGDGRSALEWAELKGHADIASVLKRRAR